jgi:ABC-type sugar transport system, permease component
MAELKSAAARAGDLPAAAPGAVRGAGSDAVARAMRRRGDASRFWWLIPTLYIVFLMLPIYWLINMSFKTNQEIVGPITFWPANPTLRNYAVIFTDPSWYSGYINSIIYVVLNTIISVIVALPAAYAFSRYRFLATSTCSSGCSPTAWRHRRCSRCLSSSSTRPSG